MAQDRFTYGDHITISPEMFGATVSNILDEFTVHVRLAVNDGIKKTLKEGKKITQESGTYRNRRPKYRKSISYRMSEQGFLTEGQIYARGHEYSLTHLLEHGHGLWQGGHTRAFPHWRLGEEYVDDNVIKNIESKI